MLTSWLIVASVMCGAPPAEPPGSRYECVILVHGLARRKSSMTELARTFQAAGYNVVNWDYLSTRHDIQESAEALYQCYELNAPYNRRVHFVTHSLGGILVRRVLKQHELPKLGRIAMLAPPNQGSALARFVARGPIRWALGPASEQLKSDACIEELCATPAVPTLVIAGTMATSAKNPFSYVTSQKLEGPNDGTVTVAETRLEGGAAEYIEVQAGHTFIMSDPRAVEAASSFIMAHGAAGAPSPPDDGLEQLRLGLLAISKDRAACKAALANTPSEFNIEMGTMGGKMWWADLASLAGWRVQRNVVFGNCRLLDPANKRRARGSEERMLAAFGALRAAAANMMP